jgi:hypothetical protein
MSKPFNSSDLKKWWAWEGIQRVIGGQYNNHVLRYIEELFRRQEDANARN